MIVTIMNLDIEGSRVEETANAALYAQNWNAKKCSMLGFGYDSSADDYKEASGHGQESNESVQGGVKGNIMRPIRRNGKIEPEINEADTKKLRLIKEKRVLAPEEPYQSPNCVCKSLPLFVHAQHS
ncbi:hypothetical protein L1987_34343 [Smallanthus sonchifolius]|uniref:Uncharacterized protein n=1 Tax=Smallanthus sonchifolius TaxID=185202 RepID=A0ACB9HTK1_9ASTR|nr:hypothetical protein L1987_34343 [Smallanthus sonchifolius]